MQNLRQGACPPALEAGGRARHQPHQYAEGTANTAPARPRTNRASGATRRQGCDLHEQIPRNRSPSCRKRVGKESPQTHERIGAARPHEKRRAVGLRRLVIRAGSSPLGCTVMCPSTLQEAKPKAGSLRGLGDHGTDHRRESKPRSRSRIVPGSTACWIHTLVNRIGGRSSRRKSIGTRMNRRERHVGPVGRRRR